MKVQRQWGGGEKGVGEVGRNCVFIEDDVQGVKIKAVLLYRRYSWVVMDSIIKVLEGFHHRMDRMISGITYWLIGERGWGWSSVADTLEAVVMWPIK